MRLKSERGMTGLEILAVIALLMAVVALTALVSGWMASSTIGENNACVNQLNQVQSAMQAWVTTVNSGSPTGDRTLCITAKNLAEKYNPVCGQRIGEVPLPTCE